MKPDAERFMREAIHLARENVRECKGGPFGAVIVRGEQIVGRGVNCVTTSNDPTAHAEVVAIRDACGALNSFRLEDCELYSTCEPCPMCLSAIYWAHIKKIVYAADRQDAARAGFLDEFLYREFAKPMHARSIPSRQLLREEAAEILEDWKRSPDKVAY